MTRLAGETTYPQLCVHEDILIFDVTVDDPLSVQVPNGVDHLPKHKLGLMLRKPLSRGLFDAFEKIMRSPSPRGRFLGLQTLGVRKRTFIWGRGEQLRLEYIGHGRLRAHWCEKHRISC